MDEPTEQALVYRKQEATKKFLDAPWVVSGPLVIDLIDTHGLDQESHRDIRSSVFR